MGVVEIWQRLTAYAGTGRAVQNARTACREASTRRVEREEVALFLERARLAAVTPAPTGSD